jgi:Asp-tRNA(Asn)/Glu-tRNA(Gln) amidotransferase A subunit family amidase
VLAAACRAAGAVLLARGNVPELAIAGETDNLRVRAQQQSARIRR